MRTMILALLVAASPALAGDMYRCKAGGKVGFSDTPCSQGSESAVIGKTTDSRPVSDYAGNIGALRANMIAARQNFERLRDEHCAGRDVPDVSVGMPADDIYCVPRYRRPTKINVTENASGTLKQYVYRHPSGTEYIYTSGGVVTSIQR